MGADALPSRCRSLWCSPNNRADDFGSRVGCVCVPAEYRTKSPGMLKAMVLAHAVPIATFQLTENQGRKDGQSAQHEERPMDAANQFRCTRMEAVGNKERSDQRS